MEQAHVITGVLHMVGLYSFQKETGTCFVEGKRQTSIKHLVEELGKMEANGSVDKIFPVNPESLVEISTATRIRSLGNTCQREKAIGKKAINNLKALDQFIDVAHIQYVGTGIPEQEAADICSRGRDGKMDEFPHSAEFVLVVLGIDKMVLKSSGFDPDEGIEVASSS